MYKVDNYNAGKKETTIDRHDQCHFEPFPKIINKRRVSHFMKQIKAYFRI